MANDGNSNTMTLATDPLTEIFGEPISVYTREQAIEDGVLVDVQDPESDLSEVTRQHVGERPVCIDMDLFGLMKRGVENKKHHNDWKGVWHDVLWMSGVSRGRRLRVGEKAPFCCYITGCGRRKKHLLTVTWDGEALTYGVHPRHR